MQYILENERQESWWSGKVMQFEPYNIFYLLSLDVGSTDNEDSSQK